MAGMSGWDEVAGMRLRCRKGRELQQACLPQGVVAMCPVVPMGCFAPADDTRSDRQPGGLEAAIDRRRARVGGGNVAARLAPAAAGWCCGRRRGGRRNHHHGREHPPSDTQPRRALGRGEGGSGAAAGASSAHTLGSRPDGCSPSAPGLLPVSWCVRRAWCTACARCWSRSSRETYATSCTSSHQTRRRASSWRQRRRPRGRHQTFCRRPTRLPDPAAPAAAVAAA